jgi:hypothetical protein
MVVNLGPGALAVLGDGKRCWVVTDTDKDGRFKAVEEDGTVTTFHENSVVRTIEDDGTAL